MKEINLDQLLDLISNVITQGNKRRIYLGIKNNRVYKFRSNNDLTNMFKNLFSSKSETVKIKIYLSIDEASKNDTLYEELTKYLYFKERNKDAKIQLIQKLIN